jgi:hypothetical protein
MRGFQHTGAASRWPAGSSQVIPSRIDAVSSLMFGKILRYSAGHHLRGAIRRNDADIAANLCQRKVHRQGKITETGNLVTPVHGTWNPGAGSHGRRPQS